MVVMTTRGRAVVLVVALALAASLLTLAVVLAKPAQAQPDQIINERQLVALTIVNPCTGEEVFVEGTQHINFHFYEDATGGSHFKGHNNLQATGVSDIGAKYIVHDSVNSHDKFDVFSESASNFTFTWTEHFIRQGSATPTDDFVIKFVTHVTMNANGEVTSVVNQAESVCE
jgi:hypothetical protein